MPARLGKQVRNLHGPATVSRGTVLPQDPRVEHARIRVTGILDHWVGAWEG